MSAPIKHGTTAGHQRGCRLRCCVDALHAYERNRRRMKAYGRWQPFVDVAPVLRHLDALSAAGVGQRRVAELTGLSCGVLARIRYEVQGRPRTSRVRPATAEAILALDPHADGVAAPMARVDGTGTARRLRALFAAGWTRQCLAVELGVLTANMGPLFRGDAKVPAATRSAVRELYGRLSDAAPAETVGARRARTLAARRGWVTAEFWDDVDIDDPAATPRAPSAPSALDEAVHLLRGGVAFDRAAARCGVDADSLMTHLRRLSRRGGAGSADAALHAQVAAARRQAGVEKVVAASAARPRVGGQWSRRDVGTAVAS